MTRKIFSLMGLIIFCLFLPACKNKGTEAISPEPTSVNSPVEKNSPLVSSATTALKFRNTPGSGEKLASIPASLFKLPDKAIMTENYNALKERMLSDLKSELKWAEKLENMEKQPASGTEKK